MSDIERTSLEAHVSLCELRYLSLERRLDAVESQLVSLQTLVLEIRDTLARSPARENTRWFQAQWALIGALLAVTGWSLNQLLT